MPKKSNENKIKDFEKYIRYRELHNKVQMHGGNFYDYMLKILLEEIQSLEKDFEKEIELLSDISEENTNEEENTDQ